jgi:hypothetical protein
MTIKLPIPKLSRPAPVQTSAKPKLVRFADWPQRLSAHLHASRDAKFVWGQHDCALAAADAILAMTGVDIAAPLRGTYTSSGAAAIAMRNYSGAGLEAVTEKITTANAMPEIPVKLAQRGDLVLFDTVFDPPAGPALGIASLDGVSVLSTSPSGLVRIRLLSCRRAWRV